MALFGKAASKIACLRSGFYKVKLLEVNESKLYGDEGCVNRIRFKFCLLKTLVASFPSSSQVL